MSFSGMVKEELSRQISSARHCRIAETAALLSACGRITSDGSLRLQTENAAVVRKGFTLLQKTFNIDTEIIVRRKSSDEEGKCLFCGDKGHGEDTEHSSGNETFCKQGRRRGALFR